MFSAMTKTHPNELLKKTTGERSWHELAFYLLALVICLWILGMMLKLHRADLGTPFVYEGDGLFYSMVIKAIIKNGWYLTNDSLGAPHGQEMYDFPQPDNFNYLLIKLMGLFTSNFATIFNLFYLMTFPLTTICALYVLRKFNVSRGPALLASLLYTFTFYHLSRGQHHLMYTAYYPVPLMVMVMLWVCGEKLSLIKIEDGRSKFSLRSPKLIASLLICVLIASTGGAYYSFFAMLLLASVALLLAIRHRSFARMITPVFLIAVIFGVFLANLAPNVIHRLKHGRTDAAERNAGEAEFYGLKIAQLLMPANEHRLRALSKLKAEYNQAPLSNENVDSSLGFIGSFGFLFLLAWLIYRKSRGEDDQPSELLGHLSVLNVSAVLIATIGGFGSLFALLISPQIRAYNRISVYIAFFSLFTVALLLDHMLRGFFQPKSRQKIFYVLIVLLIAIGVLDQTKKRYQRDYKVVQTEYQSDHDFMRQVESVMPERAMIFQLPFYIFPEGETYDHLKGYLHSDKLRWSYGGMRGRAGDLWQKSVAAMPVNAMVETVAAAGYSGIYIDRGHYPDSGAKVESEIAALLRSGPVVSRNQRLLFFNLIEYRKGLKGDPEKALRPLLLKWQKDFSILEGPPDDNWRWCATTGELLIENYLSREREVAIEMTASSVSEGSLRIESPDFSEKIRTNPTPTPFTKKFKVPPGSYSILFTSDIPAIPHPPDTRLFSFRVNNFKFKEVEQ